VRRGHYRLRCLWLSQLRCGGEYELHQKILARSVRDGWPSNAVMPTLMILVVSEHAKRMTNQNRFAEQTAHFPAPFAIAVTD
jgi:hypothetical protein